jgi:hypothetical protein
MTVQEAIERTKAAQEAYDRLKAGKTVVSRAYLRASRRVLQLESEDPTDNDALRMAALMICFAQRKWLGPSPSPWWGEQISKFLLSPEKDRVSRLEKTVKALEKPAPPDTRERLLVTYVKIIEDKARLPYIREIQDYIRSRFGKSLVPHESMIRRLLKEEGLPLNPRGQPKKSKRQK